MPQYDETFLSYHADIERKGLRSYHPNKKNRKLFLSQHVPQLICHSIYELIEKCESGFFIQIIDVVVVLCVFFFLISLYLAHGIIHYYLLVQIKCGT